MEIIMKCTYTNSNPIVDGMRGVSVLSAVKQYKVLTRVSIYLAPVKTKHSFASFQNNTKKKLMVKIIVRCDRINTPHKHTLAQFYDGALTGSLFQCPKRIIDRFLYRFDKINT